MIGTRLGKHRPAHTAVVAIIDESVLRRRIGGPAVMHAQLTQLAGTRAVVQVLPAEAETYRHLDGSFVLATVDGMEIGYVDTPARGFVLDSPEVVSRMRRRWETIRAEALPRGQSRTLIVKAAETWKPHQ